MYLEIYIKLFRSFKGEKQITNIMGNVNNDIIKKIKHLRTFFI